MLHNFGVNSLKNEKTRNQLQLFALTNYLLEREKQSGGISKTRLHTTNLSLQTYVAVGKKWNLF